MIELGKINIFEVDGEPTAINFHSSISGLFSGF
jgi:hypothetical protein